MRDYSQGGEQPHILKALEGTSGRRLLDIGAFNAETFSNSRALIEAGWEALLVEPSPAPLRGLIEFYAKLPQVKVLGAAVTTSGGIITLDVSDDALSSDNPEHVALWSKARTEGPPTFYGKMDVLSIGLRQLLETYGGNFEFVNIDVEGSSVDLCVELFKIGPRPRCVCVEHNGRHVELAAAYQHANYSQVFLNDANMILRYNGIR